MVFFSRDWHIAREKPSATCRGRASEKGGRTACGRLPAAFSGENGSASAACCLLIFSKIHENAPKVMQL